MRTKLDMHCIEKPFLSPYNQTVPANTKVSYIIDHPFIVLKLASKSHIAFIRKIPASRKVHVHVADI